MSRRKSLGNNLSRDEIRKLTWYQSSHSEEKPISEDFCKSINQQSKFFGSLIRYRNGNN
jgi:hypothetical protein